MAPKIKTVTFEFESGESVVFEPVKDGWKAHVFGTVEHDGTLTFGKWERVGPCASHAKDLVVGKRTPGKVRTV